MHCHLVEIKRRGGPLAAIFDTSFSALNINHVQVAKDDWLSLISHFQLISGLLTIHNKNLCQILEIVLSNVLDI